MSPKPLAILKDVINQPHNFSLIPDDFQVNLTFRREKTATHVIFGPTKSINSATYMLLEAAQTVETSGNPKVLTVLPEGLETLFISQSWDLN